MPVSLKRLLCSCLATFVWSWMPAANAETPQPALPPSLMWHGKPLDPFCIKLLASPMDDKNVDLVNLNLCSKHEQIVVNPADLPLKGPDYGYSWIPKNMISSDDSNISDEDLFSGLPPNQIFSIHYRYIGDIHGLSLLRVDADGGGSSKFSAGVEIKREGDILRVVKRFKGGDICAGGIANMEIKNGTVIIESNTTPEDFLTFANSQNPGIVGGSHFMCIGTFNSIDGKVVSFTPAPHISGKATTKSSQHLKSDGEDANACFYKLMSGVPTAKPWTLAQIEEFADHFQKACLAK